MLVPCSIRITDWNGAQHLAMPLRTEVFVIEQGVPYELELDEFDAVSRHALATDAVGKLIGTARLLPDGHIGRMAVAAAARGGGVGTAVLKALLQEAQARGHERVVLHAQLTAQSFYERNGFAAYGPTFMDAGIEHVAMERRLG